MTEARKAILYIALSLDGYIAKPGDDLSFLSMVEVEGEDYGYEEFIADIDTLILGRKTYDWVLSQVGEFPHEGREVFVISRTSQPDQGHIRYHQDPLELVSQLKQLPGRHLFIDGGAALVNTLMKERLIDEYILSIVPIFLGQGIRLFEEGIPEQELELVKTQHYPSGLVQVHYRIR